MKGATRARSFTMLLASTWDLTWTHDHCQSPFLWWSTQNFMHLRNLRKEFINVTLDWISCLLEVQKCSDRLCHDLIHYAVLCYAILQYTMLCYTMLWYAMLCYAMSCYSMLCYVVSCYAMTWYDMLCNDMITLDTSEKS